MHPWVCGTVCLYAHVHACINCACVCMHICICVTDLVILKGTSVWQRDLYQLRNSREPFIVQNVNAGSTAREDLQFINVHLSKQYLEASS